MLSPLLSGNGNFLELDWPVRTVSTNAQGVFEIDGVSLIGPTVEQYLVAEYGNLRSRPLLVSSSQVGPILLEQTGALQGTISCSGEPIQGIVRAESLPDRALSLSVQSHADGFYRFDRLSPGDYRVHFSLIESACGMPVGEEVASKVVSVFAQETATLSFSETNQPPIAEAGDDQQVDANAMFTLDGSASFDPDGESDIVSYEWFSFNLTTGDFVLVSTGSEVTLSSSTTSFFLLTVTDSAGVQSSDFVFVEVLADTTPPVIGSITLTPSCLWPANHQYVPYSFSSGLSVSVTDDTDPSPSVFIQSVTSSEPDNNQGDGNTINDAVFGESGFCVRSERQGGGGRTYTVTVGATDEAGNTSFSTQTIFVPMDESSCSALPSSSFVSDSSPLCSF